MKIGKKMIAIIVGAVIVIGLVGYYFVSTDESLTNPYWETDWGASMDPNVAGLWRESVLITFKDGTQEHFKVLKDGVGQNIPLSVFIGSTQIYTFEYLLEAQATGSGYDTVDLNMENTYIDGKIIRTGNPTVILWPNPDAPNDPFRFPIVGEDWEFIGSPDPDIARIDVDGAWHELFSLSIPIDALVINDPDTWPSQDDYQVRFALLGLDPEYHGSTPVMGPTAGNAALPVPTTITFRVVGMNVEVFIRHEVTGV